MRISELARAAGCHLETVRYYERIGLLPRPLRSGAGYRSYGPRDVERLRFIVRSRALGFGLDEIRGLLRLAAAGDLPCGEADELARTHLAQVEAKRRELDAMAAELRGMLDACRHGTTATCTILRALAERG
ncbi:MerR family transcriptional regulator [Fulvimonas soli]|jgi:MerR family mercuric resistance operon transcriptional regulator|uniref:MerR family transcriptional regulator n=1 Tax=Fulvimonas soli TaxID=155197 RepID=A0A316IGR6_9GAMM|nr:helix-turn-helix domain-containing protein [Fulvimonas soli]PWK91990.1 MerR family transcriptional regulator [Fulvimonas soli]TNY27397.1 MerR family transcriptional regulator [Fulvimonas soli]